MQDLQRAESFCAEKLGLEPSEERPGGLLYRCGDGEFALFESVGASSGDHTQLTWEVEDIEVTVGIAEVARNYPNKGGVGETAAWFRDGEGNVLGIGRPRVDTDDARS